MEAPVWLGDADVRPLLNFDDLLKNIEKSFCKYTQGNVVQPVRSTLGTDNGFLFLMPSFSREDNVMVTKLVTRFPDNKDLPCHHGVITLFDANNGVPKALMDAEYITLMRTAAASAVATKYLAKPGAKILAILGAGDQARSHFTALSAIHQYEEVRVWTRTFANAKKLADEIGGQAFESAEAAVKDADVIVTVTSSTTPILQKEWVKDGAHINAVGAPRPNYQELDPELVRHTELYVDSRDGALKESGDIILSKAEIFAELGELLLGKVKPSGNKTTLFKSLGMSIWDLVATKQVWDAYVASS